MQFFIQALSTRGDKINRRRQPAEGRETSYEAGEACSFAAREHPPIMAVVLPL
jgi:hypothetical protein